MKSMDRSWESYTESHGSYSDLALTQAYPGLEGPEAPAALWGTDTEVTQGADVFLIKYIVVRRQEEEACSCASAAVCRSIPWLRSEERKGLAAATHRCVDLTSELWAGGITEKGVWSPEY